MGIHTYIISYRQYIFGAINYNVYHTNINLTLH